METEPVPQSEPEAPPPPKRFPWLVPVLGLLILLALWVLSDALFFQRLSFFPSPEERLAEELKPVRVALQGDWITPEDAQVRLDSLIRKHRPPKDSKEVTRLQLLIEHKKYARTLYQQEPPGVRSHPDTSAKKAEWPLILSMPPPEAGSRK